MTDANDRLDDDAQWFTSDDPFKHTTEVLHVGDWIRHPSEIDFNSSRDMVYSKILAIDPDKMHKLVLSTGISLPDSCHICRVKQENGSWVPIGCEMRLAEESPEEFGISFRLEKEGNVTQQHVLTKRGYQVEKVVDKKWQQLRSLMSEDIDALGSSRKCAAQFSCSSNESIESEDSSPISAVDAQHVPVTIGGSIGLVSTTTPVPLSSNVQDQVSPVQYPEVEDINNAGSDSHSVLGAVTAENGSAKDIAATVSQSTPPSRISNIEPRPQSSTTTVALLPEIPYDVFLQFSLLDMDSFTVNIQPARSEQGVLDWISKFLGQSNLCETWVPDEKGHKPFIQIPIKVYSSMVISLRGKIRAVATIPSSHLTCAERARKYSTHVPPNAVSIEAWGVPRSVSVALMPMQRTTLAFVKENSGRAYIADGMGLGKTVQSIASMMMYEKRVATAGALSTRIY